jgi:hypothetical protein
LIGGEIFSPVEKVREVTAMKNEPRITVSIAQASDMAGVSKNRIREWHEKGHLPWVQWISVGRRRHRRFSANDIELISWISEFLKDGFVLEVAAQKGKETIQADPHKEKPNG